LAITALVTIVGLFLVFLPTWIGASSDVLIQQKEKCLTAAQGHLQDYVLKYG
jgi:hypothetical protein